jgi:hypothetical protein
MKIDRSKEEQTAANEMFNSFRDELLKRELSNSENDDKAILTLSSAALGISISAIKFVIPFDKAECIWLVKFGWVMLLISIITSLSAFLMSNNAIKIQLRNAEDYYLNGIAEAFNKQNISSFINSILNKITGITFVVAISAIVMFVVINIDPEINEMSKKSKVIPSATKSITESANVPLMRKVSTKDIGNASANVPTMQHVPVSQSTSKNGGSDTSKSE